ncbi:MAG: chromosome partitioning protein ParA [Comamonadaceae bacterium]|nr:chromosome partitioning protein ParA [Comamonadaceae bacterium]
MQASNSLSKPRHWLLAALLMACSALAWAQAEQIDPPDRVGYISFQEGTAVLAADGSGSWSPALINMPVTSGTRLSTEANSRTELHSGWSALRLTGKSDLEITQLDDDTTRLALTNGTLSARVRDLQQSERFEIGTPNLAWVVNQPGEFRFDVDPRADTTRISVFSGSGAIYGDAGQSVSINAGEQLVIAGRSLAISTRGSISYRDSFDQWVASRDTLDERSTSARYVSPGVPGYQQLDAYGDWNQDANYGAVWYPRVTVNDWAPYRDGQWRWVEPWGWTWVDDAPWGFAPFHYGRWAQIGPRWAWVPGPVVRRPVYSPALVSFIGGSSGDTNWGVSLGSGGPGAAWFPLAPGEYWQPGYRASSRYLRGLNPWANARPPARDSYYFFQRRPNAISAVSRDQFGSRDGRRPRFIAGSQLSGGQWDGARHAPPPPRPNWSGMSGPRNPRFDNERGPGPVRSTLPRGDRPQGSPGYLGPNENRPSIPNPGRQFGGDRSESGFENRRPPQMGDGRSSETWRVQQQQEQQRRLDQQRDQQQRGMLDQQQRQMQHQREQQQRESQHQQLMEQQRAMQQQRQSQQRQEQRQQMDQQRDQQRQNQWREQQMNQRQQMEQQRQMQPRPQPARPNERPDFPRQLHQRRDEG